MIQREKKIIVLSSQYFLVFKSDEQNSTSTHLSKEEENIHIQVNLTQQSLKRYEFSYMNSFSYLAPYKVIFFMYQSYAILLNIQSVLYEEFMFKPYIEPLPPGKCPAFCIQLANNLVELDSRGIKNCMKSTIQKSHLVRISNKPHNFPSLFFFSFFKILATFHA